MSVTAAQGFRASGVKAGIKASGNHDVALVMNDGPNKNAAAVFTRNRFQAAPVQWSMQAVKDGRLDAVVLNSGGANACTGPQGFIDTHRTAEYVAEALGVSAGDVAVCSTGLIGELLPMDALLGGVDAATQVLSRDGGANAALAIMTTDTHSKTAVMSGEGFVVGGMAKGAGMLAPGLATMLVVITTDAVLDQAVLETATRSAVSTTFERIDSDGCMSTNDTVIVMSSGASGTSVSPEDFEVALNHVCADLARQLIGDAEGASKDIRIDVINAVSSDDAVDVARAVSRSNLLKCAIHGEDPNWGRVLSAAGTTQAVFEPDKVSVAINGVWVCRNAAPDADRNLVSMKDREVVITIDLGAGADEATLWTNDLTSDYVHENSAYSS
ncbi:MAG: bifunctional glutamate N-acetyltransferase/amino-acid acetyltransferase ArgJ [Actinobacteria bacterium]|nr:bifunctional glutamate N-acetyltransferase/amino-acid acetyltransferase ArgJ [Actinomycetota bacterium]